MKRIRFLTLFAIAVVSLVASASPAAEPAWFDLENCAFCKHLGENPGLLDHVTWENHPIDRGLLMIATVDAEYREAYHDAMAAMEELGAKMQRGEIDPTSVTMCGSCLAYGALIMSGAKVETIETATGDITLLTADEPKLVAKIHAYAERNAEELAKLEAVETPRPVH
jgi:hypothetical protein